MANYPPPPSYEKALGTHPSQPPPPVNAPFYNNPAPPTCVLGGSQYVGIPQTQASGFTNPGVQYGSYHEGDNARPERAPFPAPPPPVVHPIPQSVLEADPEATEGSFNGRSFSEKAIRRAFIRKVYLILMAQLMVTLGFVCFFIFHEPTKRFITTGYGVYLYYSAYAVFLVTYFTLLCCSSVRRKTPGNYICLAVFTLAFSFMTGTLSCYYSTNIVLIALGITAAVCLAISLFACQTKIDFTLCSGLLFALLMVLFFFGWACLIVYFISGPNQILSCVYAALGALVFSLFLAYDTQMLLGGRKLQLDPEEYVTGALQLYLDVVYIFIFITSLAGNSSN